MACQISHSVNWTEAYNIQISIFIKVCCASTDVCVGFIIVLQLSCMFSFNKQKGMNLQLERAIKAWEDRVQAMQAKTHFIRH